MHLVVDIVVAHYLGSQLVLILFRPSYKNGSKVLLKVVATDDIDWLRRREKVKIVRLSTCFLARGRLLQNPNICEACVESS